MIALFGMLVPMTILPLKKSWVLKCIAKVKPEYAMIDGVTEKKFKNDPPD